MVFKEVTGTVRVYDLIKKKRDGRELSEGEVRFLIDGFTRGTIPDYQMAAFAMAVFFQGMTSAETTAMTLAMVDSGDVVDLSPIDGVKVDKHSTGGVGDTTTLVLAPLVAACGAPVAKMSGRSLGHTGGTLDKLESIPGFRVNLEPRQFIDSVNRLRVAVVGQTASLAPADGRLYALRDVTATVDSIPLIASSIMSKKLAAGADALVLDVKAGRGAFLNKFEDTLELAETMVSIGNGAGRRTVALVTDMNQPLGRAVGNALEVKEAIETLRGSGPADLVELTMALGVEMLLLSGVAADRDDARAKLHDALISGRAFAKFRDMVANQGGDVAYVDDPSRLPQANVRATVEAPASGWIDAVESDVLGSVTMDLGAGRRQQGDAIDHSVGIELHAKVGTKVEIGDALCEIHAARWDQLVAVKNRVQQAFSIAPRAPEPRPLVIRRLGD